MYRFLLITLLSCCSFFIYARETPQKIMLVLGSANPQTITNRINVAYRYLQTDHIDKIIVSGGCAAHASKICEAKLMAEKLIAKGIPSGKIYLEDNSKTTMQNYILSVRLKDENGDRIIQPRDTVVVISDHWHAISVAARLKKYQKVVSSFFIEGSITPSATDKLDYAGIFNSDYDSTSFDLRGIWPTPKAVFQQDTTRFYIFENIIYQTNSTNTVYSAYPIGKLYPFLDKKLSENSIWIDDDNQWLIFNDDTYFRFEKSNPKKMTLGPIEKLISDTSSQKILKTANCGVKINQEMWFFTNEKLLKYSIVKQKLLLKDMVEITSLDSEWPFSWGRGNVSAVSYQKKLQELSVFRNQQIMILDQKGKIIRQPENLKLRWPE